MEGFFELYDIRSILYTLLEITLPSHIQLTVHSSWFFILLVTCSALAWKHDDFSYPTLFRPEVLKGLPLLETPVEGWRSQYVDRLSVIRSGYPILKAAAVDLSMWSFIFRPGNMQRQDETKDGNYYTFKVKYMYFDVWLEHGSNYVS